jgi:hypothetical protein
MKYRFLAEHRAAHRVEKMAASLGVRRGGFYAWVRRGQGLRQNEDQRMGDLIGEIQGASVERNAVPEMVLVVRDSTRALSKRGTA